MGAGVGIVKVAAPVLIQEISHPRLRPILGSCYQTFAYIGIFLAALVTCKSNRPKHYGPLLIFISQLLDSTYLGIGHGVCLHSSKF